MLMVKPGMAYLDIVRDVKNKVHSRHECMQVYTISWLNPYYSSELLLTSVHYSIHCVFLQHPYHPLAIYQVSALTDNQYSPRHLS